MKRSHSIAATSCRRHCTKNSPITGEKQMFLRHNSKAQQMGRRMCESSHSAIVLPLLLTACGLSRLKSRIRIQTKVSAGREFGTYIYVCNYERVNDIHTRYSSRSCKSLFQQICVGCVILRSGDCKCYCRYFLLGKHRIV